MIKRTLFIVLAASALGLTACDKEDNNIEPMPAASTQQTSNDNDDSVGMAEPMVEENELRPQ